MKCIGYDVAFQTAVAGKWAQYEAAGGAKRRAKKKPDGGEDRPAKRAKGNAKKADSRQLKDEDDETEAAEGLHYSPIVTPSRSAV